MCCRRLAAGRMANGCAANRGGAGMRQYWGVLTHHSRGELGLDAAAVGEDEEAQRLARGDAQRSTVDRDLFEPLMSSIRTVRRDCPHRQPTTSIRYF